MTTFQLGLAVDASQVTQATPALNQMTAASQKAEAAAAQLTRATGGTSGTMKQLMAVVESIERDLTVLVNRVVDTSGAMTKMGAAASAAGKQAATAMGAAATAANDNMARMGGNMSGLAAQFQDVGVTAAGGMSPLMIALQQGGQITGQLEMQMQGGVSAIQALSNSFKSLFSPLMFSVIGLTALAAAGIQMVDWAAVASSALNGLADVLVPIAPYAATASAALALLYAPAILGGIEVLLTTLRGLIVTVDTLAISFLAANPAVAWVLAFTLIIAAAVTFRDELTRIYGVDIVGAAQEGANNIIRAYMGLMAELDMIAGAISNIYKFTWQDIYNSGVDLLGQLMESMWRDINKALVLMGKKAVEVDVSFMKVKPPSDDWSQGLLDKFNQRKKAINATDYVGQFVGGVQNAASGAADALRGLAGSLTAPPAAKAGKATDDVRGLADKGFGYLTEKTNAFAEAATSAFSNMGSGIIQAFQKGGDVASNILGMLMDRVAQLGETLLNNGLNGLMNMGISALFGGLSGGSSLGASLIPGIGSFLANAQGNVFNSPSLSAYSNGVYNTPQMFAFAKGAGVFAEAGPEAIMPLKRTSSGALGVQVANSNQPAAGNDNGGWSGDMNVTITANSEEEGAAAARGWQREMAKWQQSGAGHSFVRKVMNNSGRAN